MQSTNKSQFNKPIYFLIGIIAVAAALRLVALFNFGTYTFDDFFCVYFSGKDYTEMFKYLWQELHPPGYYLLLHLWLKIFGDIPSLNRLLSLILSVGSIPLIYYLAKKIINKTTGLFAALIFALSYFQIFTAVEVRMYSLVVFLGLASFALFWSTVVEKQNKNWILYTALTAIMMLTHLSSVFAIFTQWLWLLILIWKKQTDKPTIKKFIFSQIIILGIWLIWFIPLFLPKLNDLITKGWHLNTTFNQANPATGVFGYFFLLLKNYWLRFAVAIIIFSAPILAVLWTDKKVIAGLNKKINPCWFLLAWALPPFLVAMISHVNIIRLYIVGYLGFYFFVAYLFYLALRYAKKIFLLMVVIWLTVTFIHLSQVLPNNFNNWYLVNNWLIKNEQSKEKILLFGFHLELPFRYYYTGQKPYQGIYPINDNKSLEQRIIEKNWQLILDRNDINWLQQATKNFDDITLVHNVYPAQDYFKSIVAQWFEKNNWQITDVYQPNQLMGPNVVKYHQKQQ